MLSYFLACTFGQTLDATDFSCAAYGCHSTSVLCNNMRFFGFFAFFPREMKVGVRFLYILCKLTNQCPCPEFLATSCRCELLKAAFLWSDPDSDQWSKICLDHGVSKAPVNYSALLVDSPVPLMYHDPDKSWITDPDPDHPKGTQPKSQTGL